MVNSATFLPAEPRQPSPAPSRSRDEGDSFALLLQALLQMPRPSQSEAPGGSLPDSTRSGQAAAESAPPSHEPENDTGSSDWTGLAAEVATALLALQPTQNDPSSGSATVPGIDPDSLTHMVGLLLNDADQADQSVEHRAPSQPRTEEATRHGTPAAPAKAKPEVDQQEGMPRIIGDHQARELAQAIRAELGTVLRTDDRDAAVEELVRTLLQRQANTTAPRSNSTAQTAGSAMPSTEPAATPGAASPTMEWSGEPVTDRPVLPPAANLIEAVTMAEPAPVLDTAPPIVEDANEPLSTGGEPPQAQPPAREVSAERPVNEAGEALPAAEAPASQEAEAPSEPVPLAQVLEPEADSAPALQNQPNRTRVHLESDAAPAAHPHTDGPEPVEAQAPDIRQPLRHATKVIEDVPGSSVQAPPAGRHGDGPRPTSAPTSSHTVPTTGEAQGAAAAPDDATHAPGARAAHEGAVTSANWGRPAEDGRGRLAAQDTQPVPETIRHANHDAPRQPNPAPIRAATAFATPSDAQPEPPRASGIEPFTMAPVETESRTPDAMPPGQRTAAPASGHEVRPEPAMHTHGQEPRPLSASPVLEEMADAPPTAFGGDESLADDTTPAQTNRPAAPSDATAGQGADPEPVEPSSGRPVAARPVPPTGSETPIEQPVRTRPTSNAPVATAPASAPPPTAGSALPQAMGAAAEPEIDAYGPRRVAQAGQISPRPRPARLTTTLTDAPPAPEAPLSGEALDADDPMTGPTHAARRPDPARPVASVEQQPPMRVVDGPRPEARAEAGPQVVDAPSSVTPHGPGRASAPARTDATAISDTTLREPAPSGTRAEPVSEVATNPVSMRTAEPMGPSSPVPNAAESPDVNAGANITRLMERIEDLLVTRQSSVRVRLEPEWLGTVEIQIVARRGGVDIRLAAASELTRDLLEANLGQLQRGLAESGHEVQRVRVEMPAGSSGEMGGTFADSPGHGYGHQQPDGQGDDPWRQSFRLYRPATPSRPVASEPAPDHPGRIDPTRGIDYRA